MKKKVTELSSISFVAICMPHTKAKKVLANSMLTELSVPDDTAGVYSIHVQELRERFNSMYYRFIEKLALISCQIRLSPSQHQDIHTLFDELIETRELLEKETISIR